MTHILVTNDDGILAQGIIQLTKSLTQLGKVTVLAPDKNWSVSGHKKTLHKPLRVRRVDFINRIGAFSSDGAPSDCVAIALLGFIEEKIDKEEIKGYQITKQGLRLYRDALVIRDDPRGESYYWIGGEFPHRVPESDTDYGALKEGLVSITPLQLDMTAYSLFEYLNQRKW
ncbi:MAG: hypothetical protein K0B14_08805 [Anaerolineaceae bacterium]|nr:hypothetical protein [Anaerolineaceae bacterium]